MKKKISALIMVLSLIFAMTAVAACSSSSDADSSSDASSTSSTETESEVPDDTEDVSSEEEEVDDTDETDVAEETSEVSEEETPEGETSSKYSLSDEEFQEICDFIRESIIDNYLTPNNLSTEDFCWPSDDDAWLQLDSILKQMKEDYVIFPGFKVSSEDLEIIKAVHQGFLNWFETYPDRMEDRYVYALVIMEFFAPYETVLPANVTFD